MQATSDDNAALRAALRADAEAALLQAGRLKAFRPALRARYELDHRTKRRDEVRKLILLATFGYVLLILTFNFLVIAEPRPGAIVAETMVVVSLQLILHRLCGAFSFTRSSIEAIMVISALVLVCVALADFWTSPMNSQLAGFMSVATFAFGAVYFCRMPLPAAASFLGLSAACMAIALETSALPMDVRLYPLGAMLSAGVFALLGVRNFDQVSRRLYLHGLLQHLKIEGLAAENTALNELSTTDPLTGVGNRRAFESAISATSPEAVVLLFVDLDHFKQLNDRFGHNIGDACLVAVANTLVVRSRPTDLVARIGGDEFGVLAFGRSSREALQLTEGLCAAIANARPEEAPRGVSVSVSVGAAIRRPGETKRELMSRADAALYKAKRAGRGCVSWATDDTPPRRPATAA